MSKARQDGGSIKDEQGACAPKAQRGREASDRGKTHGEGASVRSVARTHDIPSNQLFHWRKLYREGLLGDPGEDATQSKLVAVRLVGEQQGSTDQQQIDVDQAPHTSAATASF